MASTKLSNSSLNKDFPPADKPYDVYDSASPIMARIGKKSITFYALPERGKKIKIGRYSSAMSVAEARNYAKSIIKDYFRRKQNPDDHRNDTVRQYTTEVYSKVKPESVIDRILKRFSKEILNKKMGELTLHDMQVFVNKRCKTVKPQTARRDYSVLRSMFNYAANPKNKHIDENRIAGVEFKRDKDDDIARSLTCDEIKILKDNLTTATTNTKYCVLISLLTGLRPNEVFTLTRPRVNLTEGYIVVQAAFAKDGDTRNIPISNKLEIVLRDYIANHYNDNPGENSEAWLFFSKITGSHIKTINKSLKAWMRSIGLEFRQYDLRHTFASHLIEDVDIQTLRELLGHKEISMTQKYLHGKSKQQRQAVNKLSDKLPI